MTNFTAEKISHKRWAGPQWTCHPTGKSLTERHVKRAPLIWLGDLAALYLPS
ncbi:hypothetical protein [Sabulicella glaciei]|uniref:Uncharacterized protein n=1 Tax=Sabulicella glaciei TaxID=2984948 RepID=A0ABT3NQ94_9PROT|nr:hypothetical protein [Roseococcus sp. MDT2-1-1]MCW8084038.1 hypothetical protein [Roseococcus sp. MDT2-1-1]